MMPAPYSLPQVYAAFIQYMQLSIFHLFEFRQEEITAVQDVNVLSFISNYM